MIKKKKFGILVFARSSSSRMPNKVLKKINRKPLLWYIYTRVKLITNKEKIVIVTSKSKSDDVIARFCDKNKINCFRGSLNNVLKRSIDCCKFFQFDYFMRICADRPFLDYNFGKKIYNSNYEKYDLTTNNLIKSFPKGQTFEIINFKTLNKILKKKITLNYKEHICNYFYDNSKKFKIKNIKSNYGKDIINLNLSIDTKYDYKNALMCYKYFKFNPKIKTSKVIQYFLNLK